MVDIESIIQKIQKLRALATSPNPHEAEVARNKAEELIAIHRLSEEDLQLQSSTVEDNDPIDYHPTSIPLWRCRLLSGICSLHGCVSFSAKSPAMHTAHIAGKVEDLEKVRAMYEWACRMIDVQIIKGSRTVWHVESYALGVVDGLVRNMKKESVLPEIVERTEKLTVVDSRQDKAKKVVEELYQSVGIEESDSGMLDTESYMRGTNDGKIIALSLHGQITDGKGGSIDF